MTATAPGVDSDDDARFRNHLVATIPSLRAFARGLCGNRELTDDISQEALLKAWAARASFSPGTNFKAWLFTILRNHFYSIGRRAARFAPWDPELAERTLITPPDQGVNIHFSDLQRGLGMLPVEQREALLLITANGLSYEEAALVMGCPSGTVKSRVGRARIAIMKFMEGAPPPGLPGEIAATAERPVARRV